MDVIAGITAVVTGLLTLGMSLILLTIVGKAIPLIAKGAASALIGLIGMGIVIGMFASSDGEGKGFLESISQDIRETIEQGRDQGSR